MSPQSNSPIHPSVAVNSGQLWYVSHSPADILNFKGFENKSCAQVLGITTCVLNHKWRVCLYLFHRLQNINEKSSYKTESLYLSYSVHKHSSIYQGEFIIHCSSSNRCTKMCSCNYSDFESFCHNLALSRRGWWAGQQRVCSSKLVLSLCPWLNYMLFLSQWFKKQNSCFSVLFY